jgi:hypothetical protein
MSHSSTSARRSAARLAVEPLEDRTVPAFFPRPGGQMINFNGIQQAAPGLSIASGDLLPDPVANNQLIPLAENEFVVGTGPGVEGTIFIYGRQGNLREMFDPFPGFKGGLNVAVGDVLGDSTPKIVVASASGFPMVGVFNAQGNMLSFFVPFNPLYTGGINVAVGNVLGPIGAGGYNAGFSQGLSDAFLDGFGITLPHPQTQQIILGTASQSSRILVTDGYGNVKRDFFAFDPLYTGGVTLAAGNIDKRSSTGYVLGSGLDDPNAYDEIIVGAASWAPIIRVYDVWKGGAAQLREDYDAFPGFLSGVNVATGSTDGLPPPGSNLLPGVQIYANLIGTPLLRTFDGETQENLGNQVFMPTSQIFPGAYGHILNLATGFYSDFTGQALRLQLPGAVQHPQPGFTVPASAMYLPFNDDTFFNLLGLRNFFIGDFDLVAVAGDGPVFQQPRLFAGAGLVPLSAPFNGP